MLDNKLGVINESNLAILEERLSKVKALELFENRLLDKLESSKFSSLAFIHKYLFEDIYNFAGEIRGFNIAKGNFRFAPVMYLKHSLDHIDNMCEDTYEHIIEKYVEMNIAHPFREGNGRTTRIWLDLMLKNNLSVVVDWSKVSKSDYLLAIKRSEIKDIEIKHILKNALTKDISNREVYMKGIDASYHYEGYNVFYIKDLV